MSNLSEYDIPLPNHGRIPESDRGYIFRLNHYYDERVSQGDNPENTLNKINGARQGIGLPKLILSDDVLVIDTECVSRSSASGVKKNKRTKKTKKTKRTKINKRTKRTKRKRKYNKK
jgi:hypothetical protein